MTGRFNLVTMFITLPALAIGGRYEPAQKYFGLADILE